MVRLRPGQLRSVASPFRIVFTNWQMKYLLLIITVVSFRATMLAQTANVSRDLIKAEWTNAKMDVIVRYRHQPNGLQHQRVANFGRFKRQLGLINGESYTVSAGS